MIPKQAAVALVVVSMSLAVGLPFLLASTSPPAVNPTGGGGGGGGTSGHCPSINAILNFRVSSIVGASFKIDPTGLYVNYTFDSLEDRDPVGGVPGLITYCVYPANPPGNPDGAVAVAVGADGSSFKVSFGSIQGFFAFTRSDGNPSNIPLDGTTGIRVGMARWSAGAPARESIVLHINDASECFKLYGEVEDTCFVIPTTQGPHALLCNGDAACKQVVIDEAITTTPLAVPGFTVLHIHYLYVVVNQPTNTFDMIFNPPESKTQDINSGGIKDYFGCEQIPDPNGAPGAAGVYPGYQGTGFTLNYTLGRGTCAQSRFTMTAPGPASIVLRPGEFVFWTIDEITRVNNGGKQEYTSTGIHILNSGMTVKWFQSDGPGLHSFTTAQLSVVVV